MEYWCDGGVGRYCVVDDTGKTIIKKSEGTNNEQEYKGIILALELAQDGDTIYSDSQLVVNQLTKNWKVRKKHLLPFYFEALNLLKLKDIKIEWVSRDFNKAGWILE